MGLIRYDCTWNGGGGLAHRRWLNEWFSIFKPNWFQNWQVLELLKAYFALRVTLPRETIGSETQSKRSRLNECRGDGRYVTWSDARTAAEKVFVWFNSLSEEGMESLILEELQANRFEMNSR